MKLRATTWLVIFSLVVIVIFLIFPLHSFQFQLIISQKNPICNGTFTNIFKPIGVQQNASFIKHFQSKIDKIIDEKSQQILNNSIAHLIAYSKSEKCPNFPEDLEEQHKDFLSEMSSYTKWNLSHYREEVFYHQHGLRNASRNILNYIRNKDIIDVGCFICDSSLVLSTYTTKTVFAYDISTKALEICKQNLLNNNQNGMRILTINKGLDKEQKMIKFRDTGRGSGNTHNEGTPNSIIELTTIDDEAQNIGFKPGFIKIHAEGSGYDALIGAQSTIELYRPVIEVASHHNYDEFVNIPLFIKKLKNYKLRFLQEKYDHSSMCSFSTFAYPEEIE